MDFCCVFYYSYVGFVADMFFVCFSTLVFMRVVRSVNRLILWRLLLHTTATSTSTITNSATRCVRQSEY